jgi:hypothetical protein
MEQDFRVITVRDGSNIDFQDFELVKDELGLYLVDHNPRTAEERNAYWPRWGFTQSERGPSTGTWPCAYPPEDLDIMHGRGVITVVDIARPSQIETLIYNIFSLQLPTVLR